MRRGLRVQVSIYECDARVDGEEITGDVEVDSTTDYTGLVSTGQSDATVFQNGELGGGNA